MTKQNDKVREFWINDFKFGNNQSCSQEVIVDTIPNCGYNTKKIHVIEFKAYLKLQEELAEARRVIEWYSIMRHPVYQHKAREFLTKYPEKEG